MKERFAPYPDDVAGTINIMAHPLASMMALSAVGFGIAGQAIGTWIGALTAANEMSQRFWEPLLSADNEAAQGPAIRGSRSERGTKSERTGRQTATILALRPAAKDAKPAKAATKPTSPEAGTEALDAPRRIRKPAQPDDLKAIAGIGPKLEQVLNRLGVWTYAQIAAWTAPEVAWIEESLGLQGRVGRDDWIAQAATLSAKSKTKAGAKE